MELSLEIIEERLKKHGYSASFSRSSEDFCLQRPEFYTGKEALESNILYISRAEDLSPSLKAPRDMALICVGSGAVLPENLPCLVFPEQADILRLSNEIHAIFRMFHRWEQSIRDLDYQEPLREVFREMLELSDPVFENGISLMDASFGNLIQTETNKRYGGYERATDHYNPENLAPDIISLLRRDPGYQEMAEGQEIRILENEILPYRTMNHNVFVDNQFAYRIVLTECIRPFQRSDEKLLLILSEQIGRIVKSLPKNRGTYNYPLAGYFVDLIRKDAVSRTALEEELAPMNWKTSDSFFVLCLRSFHISEKDNMEIYYCMEIMKEFPECFAFLLDRDLAVIVNQSISRNSKTEFFQKLAVFIRDNNFRAGTSNDFQDLYHIRRYYREAEIALSIGLEENPSVWRHSFEDYILQYIYRMATGEFEKEELYSPIYYRIRRYDEENETELLKTLKCYLDNNRNIVRTAQELFIHRSTMIYRLKRIFEIGKTNLTDNQEILHLQLTFHLLLK